MKEKLPALVAWLDQLSQSVDSFEELESIVGRDTLKDIERLLQYHEVKWRRSKY